MGKRSSKTGVVFKPYNQGQMMLLPPSLDDMVSANHPVRLISDIVEQVDISALLATYKPGGTSVYHPKMMLKILVYGYINNVYSSRKLEENVQQNIYYLWLSGMQTPDHNTINRFRTGRLEVAIEKIFSQIVMLLHEAGVLNIKEIYVDGTKIEANANRYTFVWGKSIKRNTEKIHTQVKSLWQYAQQIAAVELHDTAPVEFTGVDAAKVIETVAKIDAALRDKEVPEEIKSKLNYTKKHHVENIKKYEDQQSKLGPRNSYSKTDVDATFMRMKEDHMQNGQLKPGYNVQCSSSNQFIVNYSLHSNPTDTTTLSSHLLKYENTFGNAPDTITADAGYGSEENYMILEDKNINAFVKYNLFHKEQTKKYQQNIFRADNLFYNEEQDYYVCPIGQHMELIRIFNTTTEAGFTQTIHRYQAKNCNGCPMRSQCHQSKGNRIIDRNPNLIRLKKIAREKLLSEEGIYHRKKRSVDIEPVFGNIKSNKNFKRFKLRSIKKVTIEFGLVAIAHNLAKYCKIKGKMNRKTTTSFTFYLN